MSLLSEFLGTEKYSLKEPPMFKNLIKNIKSNKSNKTQKSKK